MFDVRIPGDLAWREVPCNESPFGVEEVFNPEVFKWLDDHTNGKWDHDISSCGQYSIVTVWSSDVALLFKLTWGGQ